jgi:hypothetical protein
MTRSRLLLFSVATFTLVFATGCLLFFVASVQSAGTLAAAAPMLDPRSSHSAICKLCPFPAIFDRGVGLGRTNHSGNEALHIGLFRESLARPTLDQVKAKLWRSQA